MPEISFALILGSAMGGTIGPHSDLDMALYLNQQRSLEIHRRITDICQEVIPVRCDLGYLNHAEPVYRYEALKGRLLFTRDEEVWLRFFSLTCREYEHAMARYAAQHRYRLEARV